MKRWIKIAAAVLLVLALAAFLVYRWCSSPPGRGRECLFKVERGWGAATISRALADSALVRCRLHLLWRYSRLEGRPPLQAGEYLLDDSMSADSILGMMIRGQVIPVSTHWVTLAPGLTMEQSLEIISSSLGIPREELDSLASDSTFLESLELNSLEGYLFPETYEFADSAGAEAVLSRMVNTFRERLPEDHLLCLESTGLTLEETVILASIVEREAMMDGERPAVAGVFLGRLRRNMRLESCATVQYALGEVKDVLLYSDLEVPSPYNTYLHQGLPPGPICSPGLPSITASLQPDTSGGYLYFVSDGGGGHLFARTLARHRANIRAVR